MSVTLVAWREKGYFWCTRCACAIDYTEQSIWDNLARAYDAEVRLLPFGQEALPEDVVEPIVVLDEKGELLLDDFVWPQGDVTIVTGRTAQSLAHLPGTHVVVPVPDTGVFGMCMAAIALEDRRRKVADGS